MAVAMPPAPAPITSTSQVSVVRASLSLMLFHLGSMTRARPASASYVGYLCPMVLPLAYNVQLTSSRTRRKRMTTRVAMIGASAVPVGRIQAAPDAPLQVLEQEIMTRLVVDAV